jgi:hypothetical protein
LVGFLLHRNNKREKTGKWNAEEKKEQGRRAEEHADDVTNVSPSGSDIQKREKWDVNRHHMYLQTDS